MLLIKLSTRHLLRHFVFCFFGVIYTITADKIANCNRTPLLLYPLTETEIINGLMAYAIFSSTTFCSVKTLSYCRVDIINGYDVSPASFVNISYYCLYLSLSHSLQKWSKLFIIYHFALYCYLSFLTRCKRSDRI